MQTADIDTARAWLERLAPVPARVRGRQKVKHYATTEAIVGGVTGSLTRPENVLLGLYNSTTGDLRLVGRTTTLHAAPTVGEVGVRGGQRPPGQGGRDAAVPDLVR